MAAPHGAQIETPRLTLRPATSADPAALVAGIGNYDVARWLGRVPYPYRRSDADAWIRANAGQTGKVWLVHNAFGLVGGVSIDGELGYWLARHAWGHGYATEAATAAVTAHFADPAAGDLTASHFPGNDRSAGVLRRLGFRADGTKVVASQSLGQAIESHALRLTRADWLARQSFVIETERLVMDALTPADWQALARIAGRPAVARMLTSVRVPWPKAEVLAWIEAARFEGYLGFRRALRLKGGPLIGAVGLGATPISCNYFLGEAWHGQGFATEAMRAFLAACFERFGLPEIEADHFEDNPVSGRVLTKLGFERTGLGRGFSPARLEPAPLVLYRLSRDSLRGAP